MVTFERHVGRLVELCDDGKVVVGQMPTFARVLQLADEVGKGALVVICADLRRAHPVPLEFADKVMLSVRTSLMRVERGATVLPQNPIAAKQYERIFTASHGDRGPVVRTPLEAITALDPVLTPVERSRLRTFLGV
jgi:hypothetical protein